MHVITDFVRQLFQAMASGELANLGNWAYFALGGLVLVEGPIATLLGAAASSAGLMNPNLVFVTACIGNLSADMVWYGLGYMGKTEWLVRYGGLFNIRRGHVVHLTRAMHKHARKLLLMA